MSRKDTGGPAFPAPYDGHGGGPEGMSLRDWFAGQALAGILANPNISNANYGVDADAAFTAADAMLDARSGDDT